MSKNTSMVTQMPKRTQERTNIYITDEELWAWAQYRAKTLGYKITSEYLFALVKLDREKDLLKKER
jgi:prophage antirepressor-like protein